MKAVMVFLTFTKVAKRRSVSFCVVASSRFQRGIQFIIQNDS